MCGEAVGLTWHSTKQKEKKTKQISPDYTSYSEGHANEGGNNTLLSPSHKLFTTVSARRHANTHSGLHGCSRSIHLLFSPPLAGESSNMISLAFNRSPCAASSVLMWLGWLLLALPSSPGTQTHVPPSWNKQSRHPLFLSSSIHNLKFLQTADLFSFFVSHIDLEPLPFKHY